MKYKIEIKQSTHDPYKNSNGEMVDYTRVETISGEADNIEDMNAIIGLVSKIFPNTEITITIKEEN